MNKPKVYIDGQSGTTGLEIASKLEKRDDIELIKIEESLRHDDEERRKMMDQADLVFFCLPDTQAVHAASLADENTIIIDASTAHRTKWTYGFAELLKGSKEKIQNSKRIANPGCHASGAAALLTPLIQGGLLKADTPVSLWSITGYTGGGKKMIAEYEAENHPAAGKPYAMALGHKHLPEIGYVAGAENITLVPIVENFERGMLTQLALPLSVLKGIDSVSELRKFFADWYREALMVQVSKNEPAALYADGLAGSDLMEIYVTGNDQQVLLSALFDNLGKGACGAAIANMNLALGLEETNGLTMKHSSFFE